MTLVSKLNIDFGLEYRDKMEQLPNSYQTQTTIKILLRNLVNKAKMVHNFS